MPPTDRDLLDVPEVAKRTGLSEGKVWQMVGRGELKSVKIGTRRKIRRTDYDAWLKKLTSDESVAS